MWMLPRHQMASIPEVIGKYRVIRYLGDGGMGSVYLAHDAGIDREVAIKLVRTADESLRRRFRTEAQSAGRLKHANIVTVHEYGEFEAGPYLVMEYIEGLTLSKLIERGEPSTTRQKLALLIQACQGLAHAHRFGVTHRDIKPSNLMVDHDGVLKIVDFGIARTSGRDLTVTGKVVGTPAYMAPEQIQGGQTDHRSDIFALSLVMFELLSGQVAFTGDSDYAVINRIVNGTPNPFTHPDADLEQLIRPVLARAMARDADRRYQSASELAADLSGVLTRLGEPQASRVLDTEPQPTVPLPTSRRWRRWPAVVAIAAAVSVAGWVAWPRRPGSVEPVNPVAVPERPADTPPAVVAPAVTPDTAPPLPAPPTAERPDPVKAAETTSPPPVTTRSPAPAAAIALPGAAESARVRTQLAAAKTAEDAGAYDKAVAAYQSVLNERPGDTVAIEGLASARRGQARARDAAVKARIAEAEQKLGEGEYDAAIAIFEAVLKQDPDSLEAVAGLGRARKAKAAEDALFRSRTKKPPG